MLARSHRIANRTAKQYRQIPCEHFVERNLQNAHPIFASIILLRADALAPEKGSVFVRKYWQILKATPKSDKEP